MSLSLVLKPRVLRTYDSDAASYITAVENADNQALEQGIKEAINEFVVGCKIRGIWESIKSCCLLCGARTLNGAIVPLKGAAPILTDFVGNYNRETGLRRTSGSFNINRNNNVDPQDNKHVAIYPTFIDYGSSDSIFRSLLTGTTASGSTFFAVTSLGLNARVNTTSNIVTSQPVTAANMIAVSILNSTQSQLLYNNNINTMNVTTTTPVATDLTLFGGGGVSTSLSRISYYSVGERLDLRLLKQVVDTFNSRIWQAFNYNMTDNDASSYVSRVEAADQAYLPNPVRLAIDNFVIGCKSDNIWSSIKASNILCGAKTINGILVPLIGNTPTNFSFNSLDYFRGGSAIGLRGNGTNKYINTNRPYNSDPQNNQHMSIYVSIGDTRNLSAGSTCYIGNSTATGAGLIGKINTNGNIYFRHQNSVFDTSSLSASSTLGFIGTNRSNSSNYNVRINNTTTQYARNSETPSNLNLSVFAFPDGFQFFSNATISFYSIGEALDLSLLDSRVTSLISSIGSAL